MTGSGKRRLSSEVQDKEASSTDIQTSNEGQLTKRARVGELVPVDDTVRTAPKVGDRSSKLQSPTMLLSGHSAAVFSIQFDPSGQHLASSSFDKSILLWDVYGDCNNYAELSGHKNAVLQVQWTYDSQQLVSASADKTVGLWDAETGRRIKKFAGHTGVVNSACPVPKGPTYIVSGSDDGTAKVWDARSKRPVKTLESSYQVTAVCFGADSDHILSGSLDGSIQMWDLRKDSITSVLQGHSDIVTSLSASPDGSKVLSNGMDSIVNTWDVRPFAVGNTRLESTFRGARHGFERNLIKSNWSADMKFVGSGSADRNVYIWDTSSSSIKYVLPGHSGCVNEVSFHPNEPIVASCSSDKQIYLGELTQV